MIASVEDNESRQAQRRAAMTVLAHSEAIAIERCLETIAVPPHESLREPENGLVMMRGRIGGDGRLGRGRRFLAGLGPASGYGRAGGIGVRCG